MSCNSASNGSAAIEQIKKFNELFPAFKYLAIVLKYFLRQRYLNEVFNGGLGSYALALMVISHLQHHISNFDKEAAKVVSLGTLLIDFLALYGMYFNYVTTGIDVRGRGKYFIKTDHGNQFEISRRTGAPVAKLHLQVMDPCDPSNNVTKGSYNINSVRNAFRSAFGALTSRSKPSDEDQECPSMLSRIVTITDDLRARRRFFDNMNHVPN